MSKHTKTHRPRRDRRPVLVCTCDPRHVEIGGVDRRGCPVHAPITGGKR